MVAKLYLCCGSLYLLWLQSHLFLGNSLYKGTPELYFRLCPNYMYLEATNRITYQRGVQRGVQGVCGGDRGGVCGGVHGGVLGGVHGGVHGGVREVSRFGIVQNLYLELETRPLTEPFRIHQQRAVLSI